MTTILFTGIGNPGQEYEQTRHNVGWAFLDWLAKKASVQMEDNNSLKAAVGKGALQIGKKKYQIILAKPLVYVNTIGPVVVKLKNTYKLSPDRIVLVHDDLDIPFGNTKQSFDKNSGGHRGVESVMRALKTKKFFRLRIGTRNRSLEKAYSLSPKKKDDFIRDFVLGKFTKKEAEDLKTIFKNALIKLSFPY